MNDEKQETDTGQSKEAKQDQDGHNLPGAIFPKNRLSEDILGVLTVVV